MDDIRYQAIEGLLKHHVENGGKQPDASRHYFINYADNLLRGITEDMFWDDLKDGDGDELAKKFMAIHSSSALAVNVFAPWKRNPQDLVLPTGRTAMTGFESVRFEKKLDPWVRTKPVSGKVVGIPNLDVFLDGGRHVVAVESKCFEFLTPKKPDISTKYNRQKLPYAESPWLTAAERYRAENNCLHLDAAQLIKHYFGLKKFVCDMRPMASPVLLYVFLEPSNWESIEVYKKHREEAKAFAALVNGSSEGATEFIWMSYPDLWGKWASLSGYAEHVSLLRQRYWFRM